MKCSALKNREPKVEENPKQAIFIRGSSTNQIVNNALSDLVIIIFFLILLITIQKCDYLQIKI